LPFFEVREVPPRRTAITPSPGASLHPARSSRRCVRLSAESIHLSDHVGESFGIPSTSLTIPSVLHPEGLRFPGVLLVLQRHVRQTSMAQVIIFQELKSFLRISIRTWLMDQNPCETSRFLAIGVLTQRCSIRCPFRKATTSSNRYQTLIPAPDAGDARAVREERCKETLK